jgi:hypothetical protein
MPGADASPNAVTPLRPAQPFVATKKGQFDFGF